MPSNCPFLLSADCLRRRAACRRPGQKVRGVCAAHPEIYEQASPVVVTITAQSINPFRLQTGSATPWIRLHHPERRLDPHEFARGVRQAVAHCDPGRRQHGPGPDRGADPIFDIALIRIAKPARARFRS